MKTSITYHECSGSDFGALLEMSLKLWEDMDESTLRGLLSQALDSKNFNILIAEDPAGSNAGFAVFSLRMDYVEGAEQSPTGYLEGIYVEPEYRKNGIARKFMQLGEAWCKENGCTQIGSDTWLTDTESRDFHKKVGFWEEDELVHFLKNIK